MLNQIADITPIIRTCKFFIENRMFSLADNALNGLMINIGNLASFQTGLAKSLLQNKNTFVILVESNGNGHITQMIEIIRLLKGNYKCIGIVIGRQKNNATEFAIKNNIPIFNLQEPKFVSELDTNTLLNHTVSYLLEYSLFHYTTVSDFVADLSPQFIINLHLPIKLATTLPILNISTQNRLDFNKDYSSVISKFDRFSVNGVLFSSYIVHNSYINLYKIAINAQDTPSSLLTIPPLIPITTISSRKEPNIVCYFNKKPNDSIFDLMLLFTHIRFSIFLPSTEGYTQRSNLYFYPTGKKFTTLRKSCIGVITSCGVETVYENFQFGLPMICIPSNPEQLFNAYDHSRKIPGFFWTFNLDKTHIDKLINFEYTDEYWKKHILFCNFIRNKKFTLRTYIKKLIK